MVKYVGSGSNSRSSTPPSAEARGREMVDVEEEKVPPAKFEVGRR
jgi:hypothetical protein